MLGLLPQAGPGCQPSPFQGVRAVLVNVLVLCLHSLYMLRQHPLGLGQLWICRSWDTLALPPCALGGHSPAYGTMLLLLNIVPPVRLCPAGAGSTTH